MAGSVNKAIVIGNLGRDPEVRYTQSGQAVTNFSIATSESFTNRQGERQERTEWHNIVAWGKLGQLCGEYLRKGRKAYVEGRIQTRKWEDRDGNTRYTTEIVANQVVFLDGRDASSSGPGYDQGGGYDGPGPDTSGGSDYNPPDTDDDIPF